MNPEEYGRMYELEDRYWWFVGRRNIALRLLRRYLPSNPVVLDLGCGTGVVASELSKDGEVVGLDMSLLALQFSAKRGVAELVQGDGAALPLTSGRFDGVIGLDIFEHIEQDQIALQESYRVLKPGGTLVLSVPAFKSLWGPHDVALMHFRRYRRKEMRDKLQACGFEVTRLSYSVFFLFPLVVLFRIFEKRKKGPAKASLISVPPWLNSFLIWLQNVEAGLISSFDLPWGSSVVAVARKPK